MERSSGTRLATRVVAWGGFLYVAIQLHAFLGFGGYEIGENHVDKLALVRLGQDVRERVRQSEQTFDVEGLDLGLKANDQEPDKPPPPPQPKPEKKKEEKKPDDQKKPDQPKPPEKKQVPLLVKTDPKKVEPAQVQPMMPDKRIAVRQHVQPNQDDNPNAHFIGDQANHVEQESVATQTSHDQDDPNPTPGGNHAGPDKRMGDSEQTKIAESDEHPGEKNRAPGERGTEFDLQRDPNPQHQLAAAQMHLNLPPVSGGDGRAPSMVNNSATPNLPQAGDEQTSPEVSSADNGNWTFNPLRPGATPTLSVHPCPNATPGQPCPGEGVAQNDKSGKPSSPTQWLGLGGTAGPGQVNLNLNQQGVVAIVGQDQLRKEREADGERRKSEHRGSWQASNFERWRSAIENYVSSVKPGNMTALNTAAVPFATYLNGMHNRIHPIFADSFLGSLDSLPATHPMNDPKIFTSLEIILTPDGNIVKMGVTKTSGITAFDIAALDSVQRASPFGPAPGAIISPDGKVYLHWEFHRDEVYACSTMNARPIMLKSAPGGTPSPQNPTPPPPLQERGRENGIPAQNTQDTREGVLVRSADPRRG